VTISGRSAKILVAALAVSAVLNLVAVGFAGSVIGGAVILRDLISQSRTPMPDALSSSFRANLRAHRRDIVGALRDFRDARVEQQQVFRAETFSRADAEAAQAKVRAAGEHLVIILQTALLDSIESLPDSVRRQLSPIPFSLRPLQALDAPEGG
jgi:hypothetical protein